MENDPKHVHLVWQPLWPIIQETSWDCEQHTSIRHRPMPRTWLTTQIPTQQQMVRNSGLNGPVLRTDAFWGMEKVKLWWVRTFLKGEVRQINTPVAFHLLLLFCKKTLKTVQKLYFIHLYIYSFRDGTTFSREKNLSIS